MNNIIINLDEITYNPSGKNNILENITLNIFKGEVLTVIGPNGGGKSTLIKIILGLLTPTKGDITISKKVTWGYMPQKLYHNKFLPITVKAFLKLGKYCSLNRFNTIIKEQKIEHLLPRQLGSLSGGETQQILFANVLLSNANTLLLDEPTQGLDINGQEDFYKKLTELNKKYNKTIIIISHDLHTVMSSSNKVICLNHHICCYGFPAEIIKDKKYISLFGSKHKYLSHYSHEHDHKH